MINFLRALYQVYSFEFRIFILYSYKEVIKFCVIDDTTRWQRVKMYMETWNNIGVVRGHELLDYLIDRYGVEINIYQLNKGRLEFVREYTKEKME
ncbi:MAG: hypothetical protein ACRCZ0_09610 [Cetobacterium sp.]